MPAASPSLHTPMQLKHGMGACLRPAPRTDNSVLVAKSLFLGVNAVRGGRAALHLFGLLPPPRVMAGGGAPSCPQEQHWGQGEAETTGRAMGSVENQSLSAKMHQHLVAKVGSGLGGSQGCARFCSRTLQSLLFSSMLGEGRFRLKLLEPSLCSTQKTMSSSSRPQAHCQQLQSSH